MELFWIGRRLWVGACSLNPLSSSTLCTFLNTQPPLAHWTALSNSLVLVPGTFRSMPIDINWPSLVLAVAWPRLPWECDVLEWVVRSRDFNLVQMRKSQKTDRLNLYSTRMNGCGHVCKVSRLPFQPAWVFMSVYTHCSCECVRVCLCVLPCVGYKVLPHVKNKSRSRAAEQRCIDTSTQRAFHYLWKGNANYTHTNITVHGVCVSVSVCWGFSWVI